MYTSVVVLALSGYFAPLAMELDSPRWLHDYTSAWQQGVKEQKPLAVFIGSGLSGWEKLSKEGKLGKDVKEVLSANYVCLYVDSSTEQGKRLAQAFDVSGGLGMVLSDRTGEKQAFHHQGDLKGGDLQYYLKKYADPNAVVRSTETNTTVQGSVTSSYYNGPQQNYGISQQFQPSFGGFSGGRLANC